MKLSYTIWVAALSMAAPVSAAFGQITAQGADSAPYSQFALPSAGGTLRYSLTASESILVGYNANAGRGPSSYTNLSGAVGYLSRSTMHPFSVVYAGGYLLGTGNFPSYFYHSLTLSQGLRTKKWDLLIGDTVTYLPQTPIGDLSGVPGAGTQNVGAVSVSSGPTLGILTTYATRVTNTVSGTAARKFTPNTSLSFTGMDMIQRYTGSSTSSEGINNDQQTGSAVLNHRLSELSSIGAQYVFTNSTFHDPALLGDGRYGYQSHSPQITYSHQINSAFSLTAAGGPQWIVQGSQSGIVQGNSLSFAASANLGYSGRDTTAGLSYLRSVNNGNGVVLGARVDSVVLNASRSFHRVYNLGGLVGYNHSVQLGETLYPYFNNDAVVAGVQVSRQIKKSFLAYASYTAQHQDFNGTAPSGIALNGLTQYFSFGLTYSPKPIHLGK